MEPGESQVTVFGTRFRRRLLNLQHTDLFRSQGVARVDRGREAGVELREDIDTVLQKNMVVSMEPMIMIPEGQPGSGGYREHDIMVLTEDSAYDITKFPFGPEHNIIT